MTMTTEKPALSVKVQGGGLPKDVVARIAEKVDAAVRDEVAKLDLLAGFRGLPLLDAMPGSTTGGIVYVPPDTFPPVIESS
ncbi:hypothetical protein [Mycobacterium sp. 050134]|uniref:hypothetical protein n=1 Tax=Mycobacterium sp. 050134 TaxID=3096111 RepID=UPI002ED7E071